MRFGRLSFQIRALSHTAINTETLRVFAAVWRIPTRLTNNYLFPKGEIFIFAQNNHEIMKQFFDVEFLPKAEEFLENLDEKTREKVYYNLRKSQFIQDSELFKKLNNYIWEFRTLYKNKLCRLFAFWDNTEEQNVVVIATHGIFKKTQKTPPREIEKAEEIRREYMNNKIDKK